MAETIVDIDDEAPLSVEIGRGCAWCHVNHVDIPVFFLSFLVLYLSVNTCTFCVFVVANARHPKCNDVPVLPHYARYLVERDLCALHAKRVGYQLWTRQARLEQANMNAV